MITFTPRKPKFCADSLGPRKSQLIFKNYRIKEDFFFLLGFLPMEIIEKHDL